MIEDIILQITQSRRIVLDLGMGDGRLLEIMSSKDKESFFVGIEINPDHYKKALSFIKNDNVKLIHNSFEKVLPLLWDNSISQIFSILPDPKFIDKNHKHDWEKLYKLIFTKLERLGIFILITEITNELFEPVEDNVVKNEMSWIKNFFESLGYITLECYEGYPERYTTSILKEFSGDLKRIRILYFKFMKPECQKNN